MVGYHYTSYRNWKNIKEVGFQPYLINKPEIERYFPEPVYGIWCWPKRPKGQSELGSLLFQASMKQTTSLVLLEFDYENENILTTPDGRNIKLTHDGYLGNWMYHERQKAHIITRAVTPEHIRLVKRFNLMEIVDEKN